MNLELIRVDETAEDPWFAGIRAAASQTMLNSGMISANQARLRAGLPPFPDPSSQIGWNLNYIQSRYQTSPTPGYAPGGYNPGPAYQGIHLAAIWYDDLAEDEANSIYTDEIPNLFMCIVLDLRDGLVSVWRKWFG